MNINGIERIALEFAENAEPYNPYSNVCQDFTDKLAYTLIRSGLVSGLDLWSMLACTEKTHNILMNGLSITDTTATHSLLFICDRGTSQEITVEPQTGEIYTNDNAIKADLKKALGWKGNIILELQKQYQEP